MNHSEPPHLSAGTCGALCLALLLTIAPAEAYTSLSRPAALRSDPPPTPYLPVVGTLSLRFQEAEPPPEIAAIPPAAAPPTPPLTPTETVVAMANAEAAQPAPVTSTANETIETAAAPAPRASDEPSAPPTKVPPAILPDDVRPAVRPEDFLPYFQIPGTAQYPEDVTLLVPAPQAAPVPETIPASSATYTQTPK